MRKFITEREVYAKLKLLERHSRFKKPYYQVDHARGELYYSPGGFPISTRPTVPPTVQPPISPGGGGGGNDCAMACNGGIIPCEGGCDTITCICGEPPFTGRIVEDPTGEAYLIGYASVEGSPSGGSDPTGGWLQVCIPTKEDRSTGDYAEIIVQTTDAKADQAITKHMLVDCAGCCDPFTITGSGTVNPGSTWTGTVDPCCPDLTSDHVTVTADCVTATVSVTSDGCSVYVTPDTDSCGTFTVEVTLPASGDCPEITTSIMVRVNNTGQGGTWAYDQSSTDLGLSGCLACNCGGGVTNYGTYCDIGAYRYGGYNATPGQYCTGTVTAQCRGIGTGACNPCGGSWGTNICGWSHGGCNPSNADCLKWSWWRCNWECSC